jgi:hypothetical protein
VVGRWIGEREEEVGEEQDGDNDGHAEAVARGRRPLMGSLHDGS